MAQCMKLTKDALSKLVEDTISSNGAATIGVVAKGTRYAFKELDTADELCLDYDVTILPPKKYLLPQTETLMSFKPKDATSYEVEIDDTKRVILGVHPYDLSGIKILDQAFIGDKVDPYYKARRDNMTIIGLYPTKEYEYRFAASADNSDPADTADAMLCDLGDYYGVEVFTDKAKDFFGDALEEDGSVADAVESAKADSGDGQKLPVAAADIKAMLDTKMDSKVWADKADKCYSCGSCVLVCPTCYCFNMTEELELSLEKGERLRVWDGCMLESFALVAGDHNFRADKAQRFRHRFYRKGKYLVEKFDTFGCVGCGRCVSACTADIANPVDILDELKKEG